MPSAFFVRVNDRPPLLGRLWGGKRRKPARPVNGDEESERRLQKFGVANPEARIVGRAPQGSRTVSPRSAGKRHFDGPRPIQGQPIRLSHAAEAAIPACSSLRNRQSLAVGNSLTSGFQLNYVATLPIFTFLGTFPIAASLRLFFATRIRLRNADRQSPDSSFASVFPHVFSLPFARRADERMA